MAKKDKKEKVDLTFSTKGGGVYEFVKPTVRYQGKVYTAEEAMKNEELLAYLVSTKSGSLKVIEAEEEKDSEYESELSESKAKVAELTKKLADTEKEKVALQDKVAELENASNATKKGGE